MDRLTRRVAARYERKILAAQLSLKWFKAQKDDLKAILKAPVKRDPPSWGWVIQDRVLPFFYKFQKDFEKLVSLDSARDSIKGRVEMARDYLESVAKKLPEDPYVNFKDPVEYLRWYARNQAYEKMQEGVTTVGDLLKSTWVIDKEALERLVQKTLKVATPEELASLTNDDPHGRYELKYAFLNRIGFEKAASRLVKRSKLDWDPNKWVDRIFQVLQANYSEKAIQESDAFREFDLHGMKVVVDDSTVDATLVKKYVKYLDEAFVKLKSKGFSKAWYGTVFIRCDNCGGVNPNSGGGVGGWYETAKDTVTIFVRPGPFLVELVTHELGHRFWFKQVKPAQRARFEDLVKTHTKSRPQNALKVQLFKDRDINSFKRRITEAKVILDRALPGPTQKLTRGDRDEASKAGFAFTESIIDTITTPNLEKDLGSEVQGLKDDVYKVKPKVEEKFDDLSWSNTSEIYTPFTPDEKLAGWLAETEPLIDQMVAAALIWLDAAFQKHNELEQEKLKGDPATLEWMESLEKNPAPVPAVSTYGASNIDEAFAEVFTHYVLEYDITQDQVESFRSVISSDEALVARVVLAWKTSLSLSCKELEHVVQVSSSSRASGTRWLP